MRALATIVDPESAADERTKRDLQPHGKPQEPRQHDLVGLGLHVKWQLHKRWRRWLHRIECLKR
jgi:hypothetical protein